MKFKTPHTGEFKGRLCKVLDDGTLRPVGGLDSSLLAPPVVLPVGGEKRSHHRETVDLMTGQLVEAGHSPEEAGRIARVAARRAAGEHDGNVPYFPEESR